MVREAKITYGFDQTKEGTRFVSMNDGQKTWALFTTMLPSKAVATVNELKDKFDIESRLGEPYDWRYFFSTNQLRLVEIPPDVTRETDERSASGIYVDPNKFEFLLNRTTKI